MHAQGAKRDEPSCDELCTRRTSFAQSAGAFCRAFNAQILRFSREIAKVSMNFGATFARETRPAPSKTAQKLQAYAAERAEHLI